MRKPPEFRDHPVGYVEAKDAGGYRAVCLHIVDGDTYDFSIDLGVYSYAYETVRLEGLDTPEVYGKNASEAGKAAKAWCETHLLGKPCVIYTGKDTTTFGRFVAQVTVTERDGSRWDLADALRAAGFEKETT